ncbi:hypothetical protein TWF694_009595 [Orbilia ellipsospora]|uniref:Peptidase S8/S53 domain-containing protein n=1 Tax=Orbilia ellipsospora TaxID=2528407 RepID=A0AAV9XB94_9PEZI
MKPVLLIPTLLLYLSTFQIFITATPSPFTEIRGARSRTLNDPTKEFTAILHKNEKRDWDKVFYSLGYNASNAIIRPRNELSRIFSTDTGLTIRTFDSHIRGFTLTLKRSDAVVLSNFPNIDSIEETHTVHSFVEPITRNDKPNSISSKRIRPRRPPHVHTHRNPSKRTPFKLQRNAPWNLHRISTSSPPVYSKHRKPNSFDFRYPPTAGEGVDIYILDTGINVNHVDFGGRARVLYSAFDDDGEDVAGHGTHIAGTTASHTYGVAKLATILGIKVFHSLNNSTSASIINGLSHAIAHHNTRKTSPDFKGSVVNLSLGIFKPSALFKQTIEDALEAGMHIAVAAGNSGTDACGVFPAGWSREMAVVSVGATDEGDGRAWFSNFGGCVDVLAPGVGVVSTSNDGTTMEKQGTSVACPHVVGVIATELVSRPDLMLDPRGMKEWILSRSIPSVRTPPEGQLLLNNGFR